MKEENEMRWPNREWLTRRYNDMNRAAALSAQTTVTDPTVPPGVTADDLAKFQHVFPGINLNPAPAANVSPPAGMSPDDWAKFQHVFPSVILNPVSVANASPPAGMSPNDWAKFQHVFPPV